MIIPHDWDSPAPSNKALCEKFQFAVFDEGEIRLPYRFYYNSQKDRLPLVVFLHGADAVGDDNRAQLEIHDIGTVFATDEWQSRYPCHIIAPQYPSGMHWSMEEIDQAINMLVNDRINAWNVNRRRVYIYGYSAGGVGTLKYVKLHTKTYAAALSICGATGIDDIEKLSDIPLWMVHAKDDSIVKATYGKADGKRYHLGSADIYEELGEKSPDMHYTELTAGYMKEKYGVNPHCSWVEVSKNIDFYGKWLFSNENNKSRQS